MKAVIFDLDGVIVSTDALHYEAWKQIAQRENIPFTWEDNNLLRGVSRMESLEIILRKANRAYTPQEKNGLAEEKNGIYRNLLNSLTPDDLLEGVADTLDALKAQGRPIAIGSSSKNTRTILRMIGLESFFHAVSDGNSITHSKPHPEVFLKAAAMLHMDPEACVVVEDSHAGITAAKAAGMTAVAVGDACSSPEADYRLASICELLHIL